MTIKPEVYQRYRREAAQPILVIDGVVQSHDGVWSLLAIAITPLPHAHSESTHTITGRGPNSPPRCFSYCRDNGRLSVPPSQMCIALILQHYEGCSFQEAWARTWYHLRWKVALGTKTMERPFAKSTLQAVPGSHTALALRSGSRPATSWHNANHRVERVPACP